MYGQYIRFQTEINKVDLLVLLQILFRRLGAAFEF